VRERERARERRERERGGRERETERERERERRVQRCKKSCESGNSGFGRERLTRPFRHARRFPSPGLLPVPRDTCTTRKFGRCPSLKGHFLSPLSKPQCIGSQLLHRLYGVYGVSRRAHLEVPGQPEVAELERAHVGEEQVGQLEVAVHDGVAVQEDHRVQQLAHEALHLRLRERRALQLHQPRHVVLAVLEHQEDAATTRDATSAIKQL
jgi:hypothetical protein